MPSVIAIPAKNGKRSRFLDLTYPDYSLIMTTSSLKELRNRYSLHRRVCLGMPGWVASCRRSFFTPATQVALGRSVSFFTKSLARYKIMECVSFERVSTGIRCISRFNTNQLDW